MRAPPSTFALVMSASIAAPAVDYIVDWVPMSLAAHFHEVRIRWTEAEFNALVLAEAAGSAVWAKYPPGKALHKPEVWVWLMLEAIG
jgi:hypothetical protein